MFHEYEHFVINNNLSRMLVWLAALVVILVPQPNNSFNRGGISLHVIRKS